MQGRKRRISRPLMVEPLESRQLLAATVTPLSVPALSSRPGATASLYLDFNGHFERQWGRHANVTTPAYDTDGSAASLSSAEQAAIREIWARVSEDYAPFNINVTTVAPPVIADRVAARVAIGGSYSDWYGQNAGGVAFVGGFADASSNVAYVFADSLAGGDPRYVAEAVSHESGHLFGLEHQALWSGSQLVADYNSGTSALAPIMGASYYADRTTWTSGTTADGPTTRQDDLSRLASTANGFGYAADDYGGTLLAATPLPVTGGNVNVAGLIGTGSDRDVFKFTTGGGKLNLTLAAATVGANLDGAVELQNSAGQALIDSSPTSSFGATLSTTLAAGTYYVVVRSSGGYGNLGRYTLKGSVAAASPAATTPPSPPPVEQPEGEGPANPPPVTAGVRIIDDNSVGYSRTGGWQQIVSSGYQRDTSWAAAGSGSTATWTFTNLAPGQYRLAGTWAGSQLNTNDARFNISSGGRTIASARANQQRSANTFTKDGASWQNLGTFTVTGNSLVVKLNSSAGGRVVADALRLERVPATAGGSAYRQAGVISTEAADLMYALATTPDVRSRTNLTPAAVDSIFADRFRAS